MSFVKEVRSSLIWSFLKQFSIQIINFIVQILLARLLVPEDFGLIAMIMIFIAIGQSLMDSGMTSSLIRFKSITDIDYATVFVSNISISILVYLIVYCIAPYIAVFYEQEILINILRIFALTFLINSFNAVQLAKFTRELNFKKQFTLQLPSVLLGALLGLFLAFNEYGVWSLVYMSVAQSFLFVLFTWIFSNWRPKFIFRKDIFIKHFSFGYKLTISGLIDTIYQNLYKIIIGKSFNVISVGYFSQADNLRLFPVNQLSAVLDKVTYPLFSKIDSDYQLKIAFKKAMKMVLVISSVLMIILILISKPLFIVLIGEKWLPALHFFQILCIASIMRPIGSYNLNILKVKGRSDLFLKVEIIKKIIGVFSIFLSIPFGIDGLVWGLCITNIFFAYFNGFFSGSFINYKVKEQLTDSIPILLNAILPIFLCLFLINYCKLNNLLQLFIIPIVYMLQYIVLCFFINKEIINDFKKILK